jgi:CHAT domain-containing protein/tetratricopeptide (TPR) repeat protein
VTRLLLVFLFLVAPDSAPSPQPQTDQLAAVDRLITDGKYAEAEKSARLALLRAEADAGPKSAPAAHAINRLAEALLRQGRTDDETARLIASAVDIEMRLEPSTRELATALRNDAWLFESRGDFEKAKTGYARALEILRVSAGPDHRDTLLMQKDLAMAGNNLGDYPKARELLEEALAIRLKQDPAHVDVAVLRHNLGAVYWQLGDYNAARDAFVAASEGLARSLGSEHPHVASALEGLAVVQTKLGDYTSARTTYLRVLAIREKALPAGHPLIGQTSVNLGDVLMSLGDYAAARRALERGLSIWEKSLGPNHPQLLVVLTNLAVLHDRTGDHAGARQLLQRGIAIREKASGADDPELLIPLTQLANLLADDGRLDAARAMYEKARRLGERTRGPDHPDVATAEVEEGVRLAASGRLAEAAPLIEHARVARLKALGPDHPDVAAALDADARLSASNGSIHTAIARALEAEAIARKHFQATAAVLPERQALLYAEGRARSQDFAVYAATKDPALDVRTIERLWDAVVRSRALVLEEMSWRRQMVAASASPSTVKLHDEAAEARARLAQLFLRGPSAEHPAEYGKELIAAREGKERAEERLAAESATYQHDRSLHGAGLDAVRTALPDQTALVSFVRYETGVFNPPASRMRESAYAAFVLRDRSADPVLVPLGRARTIDAAVARWREQVHAETTAPPMGASRRERAYRQVAAALRTRIWDPVAAHLQHSSRVIIVPDGALHLVDFAALPTGQDRYLVESGMTLHYATAERDLIPDDAAIGTGLLAIGAPAFDRAPTSGPIGTGARLRSQCPSSPGLTFTRLPETGREASVVARLWPDTAGPAVVLRGVDASEESFKSRAPGRRVLHLATHAFVLGEGCGTPRAAAARSGTAQTLAANPLLGAGLVLAGASRREGRPAGMDDGILTGEEISALDLGGVEWAVLSACDSGTGVVRAGEGIFGLRRAFQIAGVRTVIVSLWPVEDRLARIWMETLYAARWSRHRSTADAVRDASLALLSARRQSRASTHPLYWSGFVAAGDWK